MLAPVVLFVYNRPDHTGATLEALARNTLAPKSDLIIFSDAPKNEAAVPAVRAVRELIAGAGGFASVRVVERDRNFGLARSIISGVTEIINARGRVIVLEDDLVTTPQFLQYMNDALDHYERDPKAFSIGGYQFPERTMAIRPGYGHDTYASYRCCSWGWATWRDRWSRIDWDMSYFDAFMADPDQQARFNRGGPDMAQMLQHQKEGKIDSWAIRFCHAHFAADMRCIYPVKSLVDNIGLDGSGVHCGEDPHRRHEALDESFLPKEFCPADPVDPVLANASYQAFCPETTVSQPPASRGVVRRAAARLVRLLPEWVRRVGRRVRRLLQVQDVDILVVNTSQKSGGAARAAWRVFLGIRRERPNAHYLTLLTDERRADVAGRYHWSFEGVLTEQLSRLDDLPLRRYPRRRQGTFTPAVWANPLRVRLKSFRPRLVHLHWVAGSLLRIEDLARLRVPVVWTLHDAWAFTGGCHYAGDCGGFRDSCGRCPRLGSDRDEDLSRAIWRRKSRAYAKLNMTVVTPSRWLAEIARQSSLFKGRRVEVIPNGLDTGVFRPLDKATAKAFLGIDPGRKVLLFGAEWLTDPRKGGDLLAAALAKLDFPCTLLTFGKGAVAFEANPNVTVHAQGTLRDDISLALTYSAADVFICPSREDNLPNTVAEAMACGTPCAAFAVNGLPDMITHRVDGWLARAFDPEDLAAGIRWIATHPHPEELGRSAREKAVREYSLDVMTARYVSLYDELLERAPERLEASGPSPDGVPA
jgi:glycosyltransferase involved in cell wall biosynthesis